MNVWNLLGFVLNGLVFKLIGLELPALTRQLGDTSPGAAIGYGRLISLALIVGRLLCSFGALLFIRLASLFITVVKPTQAGSCRCVGWLGGAIGSTGEPFAVEPCPMAGNRWPRELTQQETCEELKMTCHCCLNSE